jgi:predicted O-methyltransferase YrrM
MSRTAYELSDWQGYLTHNEIDAIKKVCKSLPKNSIVVNIGAGGGTSSFAMLESRKDITVISVDIAASGQEIYTNEHLRLAEMPEYLARYIRVWGDSKDVGRAWPDKWKIAMVFIDGDHSYQGCMGDLEAWIDHISEGGYVLFHDYGSPNWPDVKIVVDGYFSALPVEVADTVAIARYFD